MTKFLVKFTKRIEISTFIGNPKTKALTKIQFKVGLLKHFSLFIVHSGIKNIFWRVNIAKLENPPDPGGLR